jgi:hypothetical protein
MTDIANPLTDTHLAQINEKLEQLNQADIAITKAQQAGIDVGNRRAEVAEARAKLTAIKTVYFPGG